MKLAPGRQMTFIRHFLATELFAVIAPSSNSKDTILNPYVVALLEQIEDEQMAESSKYPFLFL